MNMAYSCPMHPHITQDQPGKCPECGMDLVSDENHQMSHEQHDHSSMHGGAHAAADFLRRFWIVTLLLAPLALFSAPAVKFLQYPDFVFRPYLEFGIATVIFYFGLIFFEHAGHEIKSKNYGMMTLVSLAVGSGYLFSTVSTFLPSLQTEFYLEISTLIWVLLFGHYLEARSSTAAGDALAEVAKLLPKQAHLLLKNGQIQDTELDRLQNGDEVLVKPGEKVPADGVISKGSANFNESHISGESQPIAHTKDSRVIAGSICLDGSVQVKLDRVGNESTIGQIKKLVAQAATTKPQIQTLADRAAKYLTFTALGVSILTLGIWSLIVGQSFVFAMTLAITVLVIACPHALGLAIPTVSTIATRLAVANGLFIKNMSKLEVVKRVDYVVLDKTGTLTTGKFGVAKVVGGNKVLKIAASLEALSSHVIGDSIVNYAQQQKVYPSKVSQFRNLAGKGVTGKIGSQQFWVGSEKLIRDLKITLPPQLTKSNQTSVFVSDGKSVLGQIQLSDQIKLQSKPAVADLHRLGVKVAMLTGDNPQVAQQVGQQLGIDQVFAQVLPENKFEYVKKLQGQNHRVMMVGDGVNDAPALTQANVGLAIGAGTDVAVEAGDVVLTRSNPADIVSLIKLARRVYRKMVENLVWAVGYNVIAIPAAAGLFIPWGIRLSPEVGALLMSLSSVIVVINAFSLRQTKLS